MLASYLILWVALFFRAYTLLLIVRVVSSWLPDLQKYRVMRWISTIVDPYLNFFRGLIPPLGGAIDLSPVLAFFVLQLVEQCLIYFLASLLP